MGEAPWAFSPIRTTRWRGRPTSRLHLLHLQQHPLPGLQPDAERVGHKRGAIVTADRQHDPGGQPRRAAVVRVLFALCCATPALRARLRDRRCIVVLLAAARAVGRPFRRSRPTPTRSSSRRAGTTSLGTDAVGMDIFSRMIYAPRIDLTIAMLGTLLSAVVGSRASAPSSASTSGQRACARSRPATRSCAPPTFCRPFRCSSSRSRSSPSSARACRSIVLAIAFVNTPIYLRLMRIQVLASAACAMSRPPRWPGCRTLRPCVRHVIPNAMAPVLAQLSVNIGWSVLLTAGAQLHRRRRAWRRRPNGAA